jgi:hypothetical protein
LQELPEAPWAELVGGKPLNARGLAKRLAGYDVKSKTVRVGERVVRGYVREDLSDAWDRYLPPTDSGDLAESLQGTVPVGPLSPRESATSATSTTPTPAEPLDGGAFPHSEARFRPENGRAQQTALRTTVAPQSATSAATAVLLDPNVARVADVADFRGDEETRPVACADGEIPHGCGAPDSCHTLGPCPHLIEHGSCWAEGNWP